jgi:hypothetical protein
MCGNKYPKETMPGKPPKHPPKFSQQIDNLIAEAEPRIVKAAEEAFEFERKATAVRNVGAKDPTMDSVAKNLEEKAAKAYAKAETIDRFVDKEVAKREAQLETLVNEGVYPAFSSRGKTSQVRLPMSGKGTRRNKTSGGDIVTCLLTIRNQIKLYHWQTKSFARHTATDGLTSKLDETIDSFVESYMGRYGRPKVSGSIKLHNFSESAARTFVAAQTVYLTKVLPKKFGKDDTDLLNLRDELLGELNKVLYLFTLQ